MIASALATTVEITVDTTVTWLDNHTFEIKVSGDQTMKIDCNYPKANGKLYSKITYNNLNLYPEVLLEWKDNTTYTIKIKDSTYEDNCDNYPNNRAYQTKIDWEILENEDKKTKNLEIIQSTAKEAECRTNLELTTKDRDECKPKLETCLGEKGRLEGQINVMGSINLTSLTEKNTTIQEEVIKMQTLKESCETEKNSYQRLYQETLSQLEVGKNKRTQEWLISAILGALILYGTIRAKKPGIGSGSTGAHIFRAIPTRESGKDEITW